MCQFEYRETDLLKTYHVLLLQKSVKKIICFVILPYNI